MTALSYTGTNQELPLLKTGCFPTAFLARKNITP